MIGPCCICAREIRAGYGFSPAWQKPTAWTDTPQCAALAAKLYGKDMTANEEEARKLAGRAGGQMLDAQGLADTPLGEMTAEQFQAFLATLFETYHHELFRLAGGDKLPF